MRRAKYLAQYHKRWDRVAKMYQKGMTFEEIGKKLGCTRQWASKMYQSWKLKQGEISE